MHSGGGRPIEGGAGESRGCWSRLGCSYGGPFLIGEDLASQFVSGPAALVLLRSFLEMQTLRPTPDLLIWNLHVKKCQDTCDI